RIVAITGSNGKSTTTALTYHTFKTAGLSVAMVGNIGLSFAKQVALYPVDWYIIEVSSFQLDDIDLFRPEIAILLNITPDHLDRYQYSFQAYIDSKFKLIKNQTDKDYFIYNIDDLVILQTLTHINVKPIQ